MRWLFYPTLEFTLLCFVAILSIAALLMAAMKDRRRAAPDGLVRFEFFCDEADADAIHRAVARHQARSYAAFKEHLLPPSESDTIGATLAEVSRSWLDMIGEWEYLED